MTDVVAPELVAAEHVREGVEALVTSHATTQRRWLVGIGAVMVLATIGGVALLTKPAPEAATTTPASPQQHAEPTPPPAVAPAPSTEPQQEQSGWRELVRFGGNGTGPGKLDRAHNLAVDATGNVYVADRTNRIQKFDHQGKLLDSFLAKTDKQPRGPLSNDIEYVLGIAVDKAGKIYVSLGYDIQVFTPDGKRERTIAGGQHCFRELSFDQSQNLYARSHCSDEHRNALVKLSRTGAVLQRIGEPNTFERAATGKLAIDAAGNWFAPYGYDYAVKVFSPKGDTKDRIGQRGEKPGEFSTTFLSALAFDTEGVLYALSGGVIARFRSDGRFLDELDKKLTDRSTDLATAPDGGVWILTGDDHVAKLALLK